MATIRIPSPSVFLSSSPVHERALSPALRSPQSHQRRRSRGPRAVPLRAAAQRRRADGSVKPKQSKSRDGCITCKAKRLKCDETKPSCKQCHKRSVPCGGYFKDYKWRPCFEESTLNNRRTAPPPRARRRNSTPNTTSPDTETDPVLTPTQEPYPNIEDGRDHYDLPTGVPYSPSSSLPNFFVETPYRTRQFSEPGPATGILNGMFGEVSMDSFVTNRSSFSPRLIDLHLSGSEIDTSVSELDLLQELAALNGQLDGSDDVEEIEDVQRVPHFSVDESWTTPLLSRNFPYAGYRNDFFSPLYAQPEMHAGSPERLMLRFDKHTCGILSIKDGPNENPWRTLIWPLARDSPALYHAIASMTAFHTSKGEPNLRVDGVAHMESSLHLLRNNLSDMRPDTALATTIALAFSDSWDVHISTGFKHLQGARILVSQALEQHNRRSLAGDDLARLKFLCNTFVYMDVIARLTSDDADECDDFESLISRPPTPFDSLANAELDPLMGCASTLFPLIGRAANLCRRARNSESNSVAIISQAAELKEQMERWKSGTSLENLEDPSPEVQHALQTAEAYRYATLLYLHQAVPEIPSLTSAQLAKKVLVYLGTVPLNSRLVIVQIYPLLAAGCEAKEPEDRQWVQQRWQNMSARMWIGNIDRCCEVMMEVWERRDAFVANKEAVRRGKMGMPHVDISKEMSEAFSFQEMLSGGHLGLGNLKIDNHHQTLSGRSGSIDGASRMCVSAEQRRRNSEPITEHIDREYTVRGQLHWVGVMKDWGWEGWFHLFVSTSCPPLIIILDVSLIDCI